MEQPATSSGAIAVTAGVQKVTGTGVLLLAQIMSAAATSTIIVYDGTSTSGLVLAQLSAAATTTSISNLSAGIVFNTGLFVAVTGLASSGLIAYRLN